MSKKHFIALADHIKNFNAYADGIARHKFEPNHLAELANFCASSNPRFNRSRWLAYIAGTCGPNGGKVKA